MSARSIQKSSAPSATRHWQTFESWGRFIHPTPGTCGWMTDLLVELMCTWQLGHALQLQQLHLWLHRGQPWAGPRLALALERRINPVHGGLAQELVAPQRGQEAPAQGTTLAPHQAVRQHQREQQGQGRRAPISHRRLEQSFDFTHAWRKPPSSSTVVTSLQLRCGGFSFFFSGTCQKTFWLVLAVIGLQGGSKMTFIAVKELEISTLDLFRSLVSP